MGIWRAGRWRRNGSALLLALWVLVPACLVARDLTQVKIESGQVRGQLDGRIYAYKGIPYGADTAQTRFRAPLPALPWQGVRAALGYGPRCPQSSPDGHSTGSEDCLTLNLWTPGLDSGHQRPVLVYLHGGGYQQGGVDEALYDGRALSQRGDVVVVTLHHRLNGFGYLYLAELGDARYADSGNAGMLDLILALRWVRTNIAAFGGDPQQVALFGQSGGGAKIATLMAMPAARGLFQRAWTMSGQQITGRTRAHGTQTAHQVLARLGLGVGDLDALERLSTAQLQAAMQGGTWTPVVDGGALPRDPFAPTAPEQSREIPMVLGNTLDETTSLIGPADPSTFALDWSQLPGKLTQHIAPFMGELAPDRIVAQYRRWFPKASASSVFFAATTAARSWKGMVIESERRAEQGAPTWNYYLHWRSPLDGGRWGAPHTLDIPLVFDNIHASPYTAAAPRQAQAVAERMTAALLAFARHGDPNAQGLPHWPRYSLRDRAAMVFASRPRLARDPRGRERRLFAPAPYLQPGT